MKNDTTLSVLNHTTVTMTSREIAELTGKQHKNVMVDCKKLAAFYAEKYSAEKSADLIKSDTYTDEMNRTYPCYALSKSACIDLVTGYSLPHRHAVNQRWQELEAGTPVIPQSLPEALRLAAELAEEKAQAERERDEAIRTKAHIADSRQASTMGRLSGAVRRIRHLEEDLGYARDYKQAKAIPWLKEYFDLTPTAYSQIGKTLTKFGKEIGRPPREIEDTSYGKVKAHHADAIDLFKVRLDRDPELLAKYRAEVIA